MQNGTVRNGATGKLAPGSGSLTAERLRVRSRAHVSARAEPSVTSLAQDVGLAPLHAAVRPALGAPFPCESAALRRQGRDPSNSISSEKSRDVRTSTMSPAAALSRVRSTVIVMTMWAMMRNSRPGRMARPTFRRAPFIRMHATDASVGKSGVQARSQGPHYEDGHTTHFKAAHDQFHHLVEADFHHSPRVARRRFDFPRRQACGARRAEWMNETDESGAPDATHTACVWPTSVLGS